ncbi:MAG: hypothetical protein GYB40_17865 [Vibrionaceae bacterium]|nr:hypothetical protein [Vibrionaceae bacterium]
MKNALKIVSITAFVFGLIGCGGGSGGNSSYGGSPATMTGKVIDGYVVGATVFVDINNNGVLDADEPSAISEVGGDYTLPLTGFEAQCTSVVPTIVKVPVGAIDEDLGEVTEAYEMLIPPSYDPFADFNERHVTPLTSMLWNSVQQELPDSSSGMTCADILKDEARMNRSKVALETSIKVTSRRYNVSEADIYSDYIASQNDEIKSLAEDIVRGLQKAYADSLNLYNAHPDAEWIQVDYFLKDLFVYDADNHQHIVPAWYRHIYLRENGVVTQTTDHMTDDLNTVLKKVSLYQSTSYSNDQSTFTEKINMSTGHDPSTNEYGDYFCQVGEELSVNRDGKKYTISNSMNVGFVESQDACIGADFSLSTNHKKQISSYNNTTRESKSHTSEYFGEWDLPYAVNMKELVDNFDYDYMVQNLKDTVNQDFDTETTNGTLDSHFHQYIENGITTTLSKSIAPIDDGFIMYWHRRILYPDNTYTTEISDDGVNWTLIEGVPH